MKHVGEIDESVSYLALIGDLRRSREDPGRADTQRRLEGALEAVNARFGDELASRCILTLGDEFQGLLRRPGAVFAVMEEIDRVTEGAPLRYGLGWGPLSTGLRPEALGMDGPCFHRAREAMGRAKGEDLRVVVRGFGEARDEVLDAFLDLMDSVRRRWKPAQEETVRLMRACSLQKEVAARRGVSTSVVSETLKAAHYQQIIRAEAGLRTLLDAYAAGPEREVMP